MLRFWPAQVTLSQPPDTLQSRFSMSFTSSRSICRSTCQHCNHRSPSPTARVSASTTPLSTGLPLTLRTAAPPHLPDFSAMLQVVDRDGDRARLEAEHVAGDAGDASHWRGPRCPGASAGFRPFASAGGCCPCRRIVLKVGCWWGQVWVSIPSFYAEVLSTEEEKVRIRRMGWSMPANVCLLACDGAVTICSSPIRKGSVVGK